MSKADAAKPQPILSLVDGVAIMVGIVIGIGIFKTPSLIASNVGSEAAFIGIWVFGGLITLIGALCYAELASAEPHSGGEYHFLWRAYGPKVAILFGWARGTVIQTGAIAAVGFVLGDYASQIFSFGPKSAAIYAALSVIGVTAFNLLGTVPGKRLQVILTSLTVVAVMAVIAAALFSVNQAPAPAAASSSSGSLGLALILVLLTYGGWNEVAYVAAEMRNVQRDAARMLVAGTIVLTALYVFVNVAMLWTFGLEGLRASQAPGADLMRLAVGDSGAIILSLIVIVTALSTINGTIFTGARTYYALGRDLPLFRRLGVWDERGDNPRNGILAQGAISLLLVAAGSVSRDGFQAMVDYTAPIFWAFLFLVGLSLFILRHREPQRELPFRVPLYPLTPILFCATCLYMLYASVTYTGYGALAGMAVVAAGLPLVFYRAKEQNSHLSH
jgi:APA family basic amino acid/polyamine antiporter